jgi:co-chaperonin GroES (HSP10)
MAELIKPLHQRIVVTPEIKEQTKSWIYLPSTNAKPSMWIVVELSPDIKDIKEWDKVLYRQYSAVKFESDYKDYYVVDYEEIVWIIYEK